MARDGLTPANPWLCHAGQAVQRGRSPRVREPQPGETIRDTVRERGTMCGMTTNRKANAA
jgi:hypothetical protein